MSRVIGSSKQLPQVGGAQGNSIDGFGSSFRDHSHQLAEAQEEVVLLTGWIVPVGFRVPVVYKVGNLVKLEGIVECTVAGSLNVCIIPSEFLPRVGLLPLTFVLPMGPGAFGQGIAELYASSLNIFAPVDVGDKVALSTRWIKE